MEGEWGWWSGVLDKTGGFQVLEQGSMSRNETDSTVYCVRDSSKICCSETVFKLSNNTEAGQGTSKTRDGPSDIIVMVHLHCAA
jgi:hypothetical protein